mgnify:CR=1 FL=1
MKDVFLVYDKSCFYEIVILNYFMSFSNCDMVFCSLDGKPVCAMEGFSVNVDLSLEALDKGQIRSFILPGGDISEIDTPEVKAYLQAFMKREILIAGICAGEAVLAKFAEHYFKRELTDGTPFNLGGAKELMRLGILTICIPLGTQIIAEIVYAVMEQTMQGVTPLQLDNTGSVTLGIMFIVMSLICRYGAELCEGKE